MTSFLDNELATIVRHKYVTVQSKLNLWLSHVNVGGWEKIMQLKSGAKHHRISCLMGTPSEQLKGIICILPILFSLFHIYSTYRSTTNVYFSYQRAKLKFSAMEQRVWQPCSKHWQCRSRGGVACFILFNSWFWKVDILAVRDHEISPACHFLCSCANTLNSWWIQN